MGHRRTIERDMPIAALLRARAKCLGNTCADILVGGGLNLHLVKQRRLSACSGITFGPADCPPTDQPDGDNHHVEPLIVVGVDVVRSGRRIDLAPGIRIRWTGRRNFLTFFEYRGPSDLKSVSLAAEIAVIFH
jgi:hypothetical protein